MGKLLDRFIHRKVLERWRLAERQAPDADVPLLRSQRDAARQLRTHLNRMIHVADGRLALPETGSTRFQHPLGTDWSWRPDPWRGPLPKPGIASVGRKASVDGQVTLFHDCDLSEIGLRQVRNRQANDLAPYGLNIEVFGFNGTFLSLSIELPPDAACGMTRQHLMRLDAMVECERPLEAFARLNIQHGPNAEKVLRELDVSKESVGVDFDLAFANLNEQRIEKIWLDLIFSKPQMNQINLRDLTLCRHHRADL